MKTRTVLKILALTAVSLFAVSCFWQPGGGRGTLGFTFSPRTMARWASGASPDILRVYVMAPGNVLVPFGTAAHPYYDESAIDASASSVSYTSPPVPVGGPYSVLVAVGKTVSGAFAPTDFGQADGVVVSVGSTASATLTLEANPWVAGDLWGQDVPGLLDIGESPWVSTSQKLYSLLITSQSSMTINSVTSAESAASVPQGYTINSLSNAGTGYPWLNTQKGILPYDGEGFNQSFAFGPGIQNVLQSGSQTYGTVAAVQVAYYQRDGGVGGTVLSAGNPTTWYDADLSQFLSGTPVLDFVNGPGSTTGYVYFATKLGAFRIPVSVLGTAATAQDVLNAAVFFKVTSGGTELPILSLAILGTTLYMGTSDGAYSVTLDETNLTDPFGGNTPALVGSTAGKAVHRIAALSNGLQNLVAFLTDTSVSVYDSQAASVTDHPFFGGLPADLPGDIRGIAWWPAYPTIGLIVVGKKGVAVLAVAPSSLG
jgi:hypothetical protein